MIQALKDWKQRFPKLDHSVGGNAVMLFQKAGDADGADFQPGGDRALGMAGDELPGPAAGPEQVGVAGAADMGVVSLLTALELLRRGDQMDVAVAAIGGEVDHGLVRQFSCPWRVTPRVRPDTAPCDNVQPREQA